VITPVPDRLRERQDAVSREVEDAGDPVDRGVLERVDDVVLVDELAAWVEAQNHRDHRQGEHAGERGLHVGPEHVRAAQDGDVHPRLLGGEVDHGGLRLDDIALDRRARPVAPGHRLREEGRVVLLAAVDVGG
jgi:hypothetical protein